ncbi:DUF485 domain-containing protein [Variovorax sp. EBFNA2]|uniref:DUF485 domain-containing protein n=1 Tax=Variovorax sp. EBFNA2 TaxID=3342097 RepID=UPI0029C08F84|nr:DUF485 domain-containing protein [Variovorax boronicumulans]WPG41610.1 DUF485 domain-containing protein [Variovorax boronicumulans]
MKNIETRESLSWEAIHAHPEFALLVSKRRSVTWRLFAISMLFFFSIPVIATYFPQLFRIQILGPINIGFVFLVAQYFGGGIVAWRYAIHLKIVDALAEKLVQSLAPRAANGTN